MNSDAQLRKPKLRPFFHIIPMEGERVQVRSAKKIMMVRGRLAATLVPEILPYLDGNHSTDEIVSKMANLPENEVLSVLALLHQRGLLEEGDVAPPSAFQPEELARLESQMLFFDELEGDRFASQQKLKESWVVVRASEELQKPLVSALAGCGIGKVRVVGSLPCEDSDPAIEHWPREIHSVEEAREAVNGSNLAIVATNGPMPTLLGYFNTVALQTGIPLLPAQLDGTEAMIGPTIYPHATACYTCYELRSRANEPFYEEHLAYEEYLERAPSQRKVGVLAPACGLVANMITWEAIRMLTQFTLPGLTGGILTINFLTLKTDLQRVLKLPRCPACSSLGPRQKIWQKGSGA